MSSITDVHIFIYVKRICENTNKYVSTYEHISKKWALLWTQFRIWLKNWKQCNYEYISKTYSKCVCKKEWDREKKLLHKLVLIGMYVKNQQIINLN